jgi:glyoxylate utilization-related uncharacterized protein
MIARPLSGFAETFSQYIVELAEGGGSDNPDDDPEVGNPLVASTMTGCHQSKIQCHVA